MSKIIYAANNTLQNASADVSSGFGSAHGLLPVAITVVVALVFAVFIGSSVQRIEWLHSKLRTFSRSLYYTLIGIGTTVVVGVVAYPVYLISQSDGQTKTYALYAIGVAIGGYAVFTVLGYVVDYLILGTVREYLDRDEIIPEATESGKNDELE